METMSEHGVAWEGAGTARAMVLERFKSPLVERSFSVVPLFGGEVLVRMAAAGICGSDVHMWRGEDERTPLPMILGHEGVGYVASSGGPVRDMNGRLVREGDLVAWNRGVSCGHCFQCSVKRTPSLCPDRWAYGIHRGSSERPYLNGCYSTHIVLSAGTDIFVIDGGPSLDPAAIVGASCSGATVAHAFELAPPEPGDTVVVQGPGPLGMFAVAFARFLGAGQVIVVGGTPSRLELARRMGASHVLHRGATTEEERRQTILDLTAGRGADLVVEAAGVAEAFEEGVRLVRAGGTYVSVGFGVPAGLASLDCFRDVVRRNLRIQGVWVSDTRHMRDALELVMAQPAKFRELVGPRYPLEQANEALRAMEDRSAVKAVLDFGGL